MAYATPGDSNDHSVGRIDEVAEQFRRVGVPGIAHQLELAHYRLSTDKRPRLRPTLRGTQDGVGVVQLTNGIHVRRVPRLDEGFDDLHVLPRHRPRSIPPKTGCRQDGKSEGTVRARRNRPRKSGARPFDGFRVSGVSACVRTPKPLMRGPSLAVIYFIPAFPAPETVQAEGRPHVRGLMRPQRAISSARRGVLDGRYRVSRGPARYASSRTRNRLMNTRAYRFIPASREEETALRRGRKPCRTAATRSPRSPATLRLHR